MIKIDIKFGVTKKFKDISKFTTFIGTFRNRRCIWLKIAVDAAVQLNVPCDLLIGDAALRIEFSEYQEVDIEMKVIRNET